MPVDVGEDAPVGAFVQDSVYVFGVFLVSQVSEGTLAELDVSFERNDHASEGKESEEDRERIDCSYERQ